MGPHISRPISSYKTLGIKVGHTRTSTSKAKLGILRSYSVLAILPFALFCIALKLLIQISILNNPIKRSHQAYE